ncbi:endonuclease, partial [Pseudarthrobacter sp. NamB4]
MGKAAVAGAFAAIDAALAVLNAELDGSGPEAFSEADPLAGLAGGCLDVLAGAAGVQAKVAGLVARATG